MTDPPDLTALRAAAAKLHEALAREGWPDTIRVQEAAEMYGEIREPRWLTQAAQLRLLVDAEMLEQQAGALDVGEGWVVARVALGGLVREWAAALRGYPAAEHPVEEAAHD